MWPIWLLLLWAPWPNSKAQSNYASQANDIEYQPGLPPSTILDGKVTKLDDISSKIFLNRTKASLNCSQGSMAVTLTFDEQFYGIAFADFDRNSACMVKGRGLYNAVLELPLKGCGTRQDPQRVFTNNIVVRFHPYLEMDGDEVITIVCRYPPPIAPPPPNPPAGIIGPVAPAAVAEPPLKGFHILLIICSLLFLALLLIGLGCSYMCLKRRPMAVVHRQQFSTTASEITKLSGSSFGNISMFEGLKIPRAHALLHTAISTSGSEANLVIEHSDTLPSDYPSESHSEVDEERSLPVSSAGSYEHKAYIYHQQQQETRASSSLYSENIAEIETATRIMRHQMTMPEPKFDVQMRVKKAPAPASPLPSESDASIALERNLTTILERDEPSRYDSKKLTTFSYVPELHSPPPSSVSRQQTPPVYSRILRKQAEKETIIETVSSPPLASIHRPRSLTSLTDVTEARSLTEVTDSTHAKYRVANLLAPSPPPPPPIAPTVTHTTEQYSEHIRKHVEPLVEPVVTPRRGEMSTHRKDDVYTRTVTEKKTIEDIEHHRRHVIETYYKKKPQDPKWDVTIRNYPTEEMTSPMPEWENFSDISSASNLTMVHEPGPSKLVDDEPGDELDVTIEPTYTARADIPRQHHGMDPETVRESMFTLSRVLEPQYAVELTEDERKKWKEIITTESTLRTLLTEAVVKEDYELIRKDSRYTNLFPPPKWDVIIRILSPPNTGSVSSSSNGRSGQRYKRAKTSEWDTRSRRSSLPTLYEYESDGGGSVRIISQEQARQMPYSGAAGRIRRLSSTRGGSDADLRSMSEMTVRDFVRQERDDLSLSSFEGESLVRSLSQPSLARSGSEFTEHWGISTRNLPNWAIEEDCSSVETTPRAVRRNERVDMTSSFEEARSQGAPGTSTFTRSTKYMEKECIQITENQKGSGWFLDDSEPEMQI